jgi:SAM-dependent methyltransferase
VAISGEQVPMSQDGADLGERNRAQYATGYLARAFESRGRWIDLGEQAAVTLVAGSSRGRPILDIGVGAGRTTSLLRLLSDDYVGVDYSHALVERARLAHPGVDLRWADARDLSELSDRRFALVLFSFNGLDSVEHDDRATIMRQMRSVLAPGGNLVYTTYNKLGPYFNEHPWHYTREPSDGSLLGWSVRLIASILLGRGDVRRRWSTWWRFRPAVRDYGDWGIAPLFGPGSGLLVHWTTPGATVRELEQAGLALVAFFDGDGRRLAPDEDTTSGWFHVVARRPVEAANQG